MLKKIASLLFLFGSAAFAQNLAVVPVVVPPSNCYPVPLYAYQAGSTLYISGPGNTCVALTAGGGGTGTVTTVSVTTANGVSGTVTNPTTTPAIAISLGAITPTSVAASGTVSGTGFLSGTPPVLGGTFTAFYVAGYEGTEPTSLSAGASGFVMDSTCNEADYWANGVNKGCLSAYFQKALSLVAGTYANGDFCTYASSGTVLNCNTALGTFSTANYPTWSSGTPFVKMTAAGTFSLDTGTYQVALNGATTNLATGSLLDETATGTSAYGTINANGFFQTNLPNSATATVLNETACENSSGNAQLCTANTKSHVIGACVSGCGSTGYPKVAVRGNVASLVFDSSAAVTAGDWVVTSATAGLVSDTGSGTYPTCGNQVVGVATTSGLASTTQSVLIRPDALPACLTGIRYANNTSADTAATSAQVQTAIGASVYAAYSGLTLTAQSTGFTVAGGTTSKTLTVAANVNTGTADGTLAALAFESTATAAQGGTGIDTSASTGLPQIASGTWKVCNPAFTAISLTSYAGTAATAGCYQSNWTVSLAVASTTTVNVSGLVSGATLSLKLYQDSSGGNTVTLGTGCTWLQGGDGGWTAQTTPALSGAALKFNLLVAIYDGTNCLYNVE